MTARRRLVARVASALAEFGLSDSDAEACADRAVDAAQHPQLGSDRLVPVAEVVSLLRGVPRFGSAARHVERELGRGDRA